MSPTFDIDRLSDRVLDLAIQVQQIPAPTFKEQRRAAFLRERLEAEGLTDVSSDRIHNVFARLPGRRSLAPLVVTAHLDTVFSARQVPVRKEPGRIYGPGIGDNALGVAALLALVWMLRETRAGIDSDIWLVGNTCEEGLGNLRGMISVVERFRSVARGYLVLEGTALPQVYHRAVGVKRYRVSVKTTGGHSWTDYGKPSAVHEVAQLVSQLAALPLPATPRTTLNVGKISGGTGINVLAPSAQFELDIRSESPHELQALDENVRAAISASAKETVEVRLVEIGKRPAGELPGDHPWVRLALDCIAQQGMTGRRTSGSTDANIPLGLGLPAIALGITTGSGTHTVHEYIDIPPVRQGLLQLFGVVTGLLKQS